MRRLCMGYTIWFSKPVTVIPFGRVAEKIKVCAQNEFEQGFSRANQHPYLSHGLRHTKITLGPYLELFSFLGPYM